MRTVNYEVVLLCTVRGEGKNMFFQGKVVEKEGELQAGNAVELDQKGWEGFKLGELQAEGKT